MKVLEELKSVLSEGLKVLKASPEIAEDDPQFKEFFEGLLAKRFKVGFDEKSGKGKIALTHLGDIVFEIGSEKIWIGINDNQFRVPFLDGKGAVKFVDEIMNLNKLAGKLGS